MIALGVLQGLEDFLVHLWNESVERLRPIERNGRDAVLFFVDDGFVRHSYFLAFPRESLPIKQREVLTPKNLLGPSLLKSGEK